MMVKSLDTGRDGLGHAAERVDPTVSSWRAPKVCRCPPIRYVIRARRVWPAPAAGRRRGVPCRWVQLPADELSTAAGRSPRRAGRRGGQVMVSGHLGAGGAEVMQESRRGRGSPEAAWTRRCQVRNGGGPVVRFPPVRSWRRPLRSTCGGRRRGGDGGDGADVVPANREGGSAARVARTS